MTNTKHSIYKDVEFEDISELTTEQREIRVKQLQVEIDDIIAQKMILQKKQYIVEQLQSLYE